MGKAARLLKRSATREVCAGGVWWRIRRVNAMDIMLRARKLLLPGATDAAEARREAVHDQRGDIERWREKTEARAIERVARNPELLADMADAAAAAVCAGVTHALIADLDDIEEHAGTGAPPGEWDPLRIVMTREEAEDDDDALWVYDLTQDQVGSLTTSIQELSSASSVRGFPGGAT